MNFFPLPSSCSAVDKILSCVVRMNFSKVSKSTAALVGVAALADALGATGLAGILRPKRTAVKGFAALWPPMLKGVDFCILTSVGCPINSLRASLGPMQAAESCY